MHNAPHIVLTGMPGVGKSTLGKSLAARLGRPLWDTDELLAERLGSSLEEFIVSQGEFAFRSEEEATLASLVTSAQNLSTMPGSKPLVIATGGGSVLRPANRRFLRTLGTVFYLWSSPNVLANRLEGAQGRPLLRGEDMTDVLTPLYQQRDPLYRSCADWIISNEDLGSSSAFSVPTAQPVDASSNATLMGVFMSSITTKIIRAYHLSQTLCAR